MKVLGTPEFWAPPLLHPFLSSLSPSQDAEWLWPTLTDSLI